MSWPLPLTWRAISTKRRNNRRTPKLNAAGYVHVWPSGRQQLSWEKIGPASAEQPRQGSCRPPLAGRDRPARSAGRHSPLPVEPLRPACPPKDRYHELKPQITAWFDDNYRACGYRRIRALLLREGITDCSTVVRWLMNPLGKKSCTGASTGRFPPAVLLRTAISST